MKERAGVDTLPTVCVWLYSYGSTQHLLSSSRRQGAVMRASGVA